MKLYRWTSLAVLAAAVMFALAACSSEESKPASEGSKEPIIIGMAIAKSGFVVPFDQPPAQAFEMYVEKVNADGGVLGRQIEIISADTKSDLNAGKTAAESLIGQGADFLIVTCDYDYGGAAARAANAKSIIVMSLCAAAPQFGVQGIGPYAFTPSWGTPSQAGVAAEFAASQDWSKAFILCDDSIAATKSACSYFEDAFTNAGGTVSGEASFTNGDTAFASQVAAIKSSEAEFIYTASYPPGGVTELRQLRSAGVELPILADSGFDGEYWHEGVPDLSNFYFTASGSLAGDDSYPAINTFVADFKSAYGEAPVTSFAIQGYVDAQILVEAIERAGSTDSDKVLAEMNKFSDVETLQGPTTFTPTTHFNSGGSMAVIQTINGENKFVVRIEPSYVPEPDF